MLVAAVTETSTKMSVTSIVLALIFIVRLFSTSTSRVPKLNLYHYALFSFQVKLLLIGEY